MIRTLQNTIKQDKECFAVPKSVQEAIPIHRLWPDGIFQFGTKYSKSIRLSDINYAIASKEDKTSMFLGYSELLNALDTGSTTKITINNKRLNRENFQQEILIPRRDDYLDGYRAEYNAMLMDKVTDSSNSVVQERYITLSVHRKSIEEARTFFDRVTADVISRLNHLDSHCEELDAVERLRVLHDFYRTGEETEYHLSLRECMRKGLSFKDAICPDSLEFKRDHFRMGEKYGRVLFLKEYASYIKDSMINELTALNRTMMLSIDVIPVPTDEAVREMQNRLLGVETNVTNWQRRQNSNNNFSAVVPYDMEQQRKETREMLDDLTTRDQRMMFAVVTLVHLADTKEELDSDTDALQSIARKHLCQLSTLSWQQADGLATVLPLGLRRIDALRTLTTEALAVLMPFKTQEVRDRGGVYYGQNVISKNLIIANRKELLNGNGFVLGVSGSGKSFMAKQEIVGLALNADDQSKDQVPDDIIVIDPEAEYRPLIEGLGGEVISISATSPNHINAMDMEQGYGDGENPVVLKSEFLLPCVSSWWAPGSCPPRRNPSSTAVRLNATTHTSGAGIRGASPHSRTSMPSCSGSRRPRPATWPWPLSCSLPAASTPLPSPPTWTPTPASSAMTSGIWVNSSSRWGCWWCWTAYSIGSSATGSWARAPGSTLTRSTCCSSMNTVPTSCSPSGSGCASTAPAVPA